MKTNSTTHKLFSAWTVTALLFLSATAAFAAGDVTSPGDPIIITGGSAPANEGVANAIDNNLNTKYLNFSGAGTGLIVTPSSGSSIITAISIVSGNDAPDRDPTSVLIEGSTTGSGGPFTLITPVALPVPAFPNRLMERIITFPNTTAYTTYRVTFPTLNGGSLMQVTEVQLLDGLPTRAVGLNWRGRSAANPDVAASALAGVPAYAQRNWNNVNEEPGLNNPNANSGALNDRDGVWTPITMTFDANDSWNNDGVKSSIPNYALMDGIIKAGQVGGAAHTDTFTWRNVPAGTYKMVVYADVNNAGAAANFSAGGTTFYMTEFNTFNHFYQQAVNTTDPGTGGTRDTGNYVVFNNLVPDANGNMVFTMTWPAVGGDGAGMAAVQLLSIEPKAISVVGAGFNKVRITFNSPVADSATDTANYSISGGVTVTGATLDAATHTVVLLTTTGQTPFSTYTLTMNGLTGRDAPFAPIGVNTRATFKSSPPFDVAVSFPAGGSGGARTPLAATDVAGVYPTANWNLVDGISDNGVLQDGVALKYADGPASPVTLTFRADEQWNSGTISGGTDPNRKLLHGYFGFSNDGNPRPLQVKDVPEGTYSVVVYSLRDGSGEPEGFTINNDSATTLHVLSEGAGDWNANPAFRRGTSTDPNARQLCNYVQFDNVQPVNGTITIDARSESFRSPVNGIQLVLTDPVPIAFVTGPANQTVAQGNSFTFTAQVTGKGPRQIQWYTNGVPIPGATGYSYTGTATLALSGVTFSISVSNDVPSGDIRSAVLTVVQGPAYLAADSLDSLNSICLRFDKPISASSASQTSHYSVNNGVTVNSAALSPSDNTVVILQTSPLTVGTIYTVTVTGLLGADNNLQVPNPDSKSFTAGAAGYSLNHRIVVTRYEGLSNSQGVPAMTTHPSYPSNPTATIFDPPLMENLHPNADGINNYGGQFLGIYIAPSSGNYQFGIASDDNSTLYLSTDADPAHLVQMAAVPDWSGDREYQKFSTQISKPVSLTAGNRYYLMALYKEGGGGDHCEVAVRRPGDGPIVNGTTSIPLDQFDTRAFYRAGGVGNQLYIPGPMTITSPPAAQSVDEGRTATFSVDFIGTPPTTIQWYSNGVVVAGATGKTLKIVGTIANNGAQIHARVQNLCSAAVSPDVSLTVTEVKPTITFGGCDPADRAIRLVFSQPVDSASATTAGNYQIDGGLTINTAALLADNRTVLLGANDVLVPNQLYTLTVGNVVDREDNANVMDNVNVPITGCICTNGVVLVEMYRGDIGPNYFQTITNNPKFPVADQMQRTGQADLLALLNSSYWQQTPNSIWTTAAGSPAAPNGQENYALRMRGYIVPDVSGNYVFKARADDSALLVLSTDASAANLRQLIYAQGDCGACGGPTSASVPLVAGQSYYFESLFQEGGGGDYLEVQWNPNGAGFVDIPPANLRYCVDPQQVLFTINGPTSQQVTECRPVTFSVVASAPDQGPINLQWQRFDPNSSTWVNIPGATGSSYTIASANFEPDPTGDNGAQFRVHGSVFLREVDSAVATLTVNPDVVAPTIVSAVGDETLRHVWISFSERLDQNSAQDPTLYSVTGADNSSPIVLGATLVEGTNVLLLLDTPLTQGIDYGVTVGQGEAYVFDACVRNPVDSGVAVHFRAWIFVPCLATFQTYEVGSGTTIPLLTGNPLYPRHPRETRYIAGIDSRLAYPDDTHENYGGRIWGYITPPADGDYVFYRHNDDDMSFRLNSNSLDSENPAGATELFSGVCCNGDVPYTQASPAVHLVTGVRYYFEGLWKEGGGGDYLQIAATQSGGPAPTLPLGPDYIGTYLNPDILSSVVPTLPLTGVRPLGSMVDRGFDVRIVQVATNIANTLLTAEQMLAGAAGPNVAGVPYFVEPGVINYNIPAQPSTGSLQPDALFPGIPGTTASTDNIALEALAYVELHAGYHCMIVNSDDGFRVTAGCVGPMTLGQFDGGRGSSDSPFLFIVPQDGLYPMRLIWEQGGGGANLEWVDIQPGNPHATATPLRYGVNENDNIKAFVPSSLTRLSIVQSGNQVTVSWADNNGTGMPCHHWKLQSTPELHNNPNDNVWTDSPSTVTIGSTPLFFRLIDAP